MKEAKHLIYMSIALGLLIYAAPRLEIGQGLTLPTVFGIVWISMALLIIAAHLHNILGVDEEAGRELERIKRYRRWRQELRLSGKIRG